MQVLHELTAKNSAEKPHAIRRNQHWHLTHVAHHQPVAVLARLWIKIIAFTLFHAFAIVHGKLFRLGQVTLQELRKRIYRSLLCGWPIRCFSG